MYNYVAYVVLTNSEKFSLEFHL